MTAHRPRPPRRAARTSRSTAAATARRRPGAPPSDLELCVNELVALLAGEPHSDAPQCQCPVIGAAMMRYNDRVDDDPRQALIAFDSRPRDSLAAGSVGTRGDGHQLAARLPRRRLRRPHRAPDLA